MDKYYKWVKASEELSEHYINVFARYIDKIYGNNQLIAYYDASIKKYRAGTRIYDLGKVEWLKEVEPLNVEEWIRIENKLPEAGKLVLFATKDCHCIGKLVHYNFIADDGQDSIIKPTHWQLLPKPPKIN